MFYFYLIGCLRISTYFIFDEMHFSGLYIVVGQIIIETSPLTLRGVSMSTADLLGAPCRNESKANMRQLHFYLLETRLLFQRSQLKCCHQR